MRKLLESLFEVVGFGVAITPPDFVPPENYPIWNFISSDARFNLSYGLKPDYQKLIKKYRAECKKRGVKAER